MFKCLRPKLVYNKYTGEQVLATCGHCVHCEIEKSKYRTSYSNMFNYGFKFMIHCVLTYDNDYLPVAIVDRAIPKFYHDSPYYVKFLNQTSRLGEINEVVSEYYVDSKEKHDDIVKAIQICNLDEYFPDQVIPALPYVSIKELQNFHKRFRINLQRYCKNHNIDEVLYYNHYSVSEYGAPVYHLRPHYHCLFFFNSDKFLEVFGEVLCKSWKFGFVRWHVADGAAGSYVSSYLNSSLLVPEPFKTYGFKTSQVHSVGLLQKLFKERFEEVYQLDPRKIVENGLQEFFVTDTRTLPCSLSSFLFPKCVNFSRSDIGQLYKIYTVYSTAKDYLESNGYVTDSVMHTAFTLCYLYKLNLLNEDLSSVIDMYHESLTNSHSLFDFVYRLLLLSQHFLRDICCALDDPLVILSRIKYIQKFWFYRDQKLLGNFYTEQDEILNDSALWFTILFMYNNFLFNGKFMNRLYLRRYNFKNKYFSRFYFSFQDSPIFPPERDVGDIFYKYIRDSSYSKAIDKVKHKELYDIELINYYII